jgi:gamma-glutamylcyclotransferase (GGCT)/AIG2-like uncharacterized protein YtfP
VTDRLFVYGSLRSDAPHHHPSAAAAFARLKAGAACEGRARVSGRLHAPSWYPAFIPDPSGQVPGEVWRINDAGLLAWLDAYEGEAYVREALRAHMENGPTVTAWCYRYRGGLAGVPLIPSGDYLDWVRQRP